MFKHYNNIIIMSQKLIHLAGGRDFKHYNNIIIMSQKINTFGRGS